RRDARRPGSPDGDVLRRPLERGRIRSRVALRRIGRRRAAGSRCRTGSAKPSRAARKPGRDGRDTDGGHSHGPHRRRDGAPRYTGPARRSACPREGGAGVITTNLSTRPFYNQAAVQFWLLIVAFVAVLATIFNVSRLGYYSRSDTHLSPPPNGDHAPPAPLPPS